jgi:NAD(P)-dependent dehydrogenase (short-subunit alcohol dehydrogenase family)
MSLMRGDLLKGRRIAVTADVDDEVVAALVRLGGEIEILRVHELAPDEERVGEWARAHAPLHALVHCAGSSFRSGGAGGLRATLDGAWAAVREVAVGALIGGEEPGKLVFVAPHPGAGPLAEAARAGLENLARTLSVEWARYALTAVIVAPGVRTSQEHIAGVVSFLVSEAGGYLSGCRLDLGRVR